MYNDVITINCPMLAKSIIVNNIKVKGKESGFYSAIL